VKTALTAAETGHLVFSTLHTISATDSINRIIDFFPLTSSASAHVARIVAARHRQPKARREARRRARAGGGSARVDRTCVRQDRQRDETHEIESIIAEGSYYGMQTFDQSLLGLYRNGTIDLREAIAASTLPTTCAS